MSVLREILCWATTLYIAAFFVRIILSWFPVDLSGFVATLGGFVYIVTDPLMRPLRRLIPPMRLGMVALDFVPAIIVTVLFVLRSRVICN